MPLVRERAGRAGQAAASVAVWPADDLERRVIAALDFALLAVQDFGETGYADAVRPALGFGPEKVVAEATMLAYAAAGASDSALVRARVDQLAARVAPLVRSRAAAADLALNPDRAFKRIVPHVLLTALGHPDPRFDAFAATQAARALAHASDEPATVLAERRWIMGVWGQKDAATPGIRPGTVLDRPFDLLVSSREDPYGLTHLLFYVTDFGRAPGVALGRPRAELLADVEALLIRYLDHEDYDLAGELLMAWPQLGAPWSPAAAFAFRVLADVEDAAGVLPCGNVDPERLATLKGVERTRYARAASYHTAFVMGFLCATILRSGVPLPLAGPAGADLESPDAWRAFRAMVADDRGHWQPVFERCEPAERRALAPMLCELALAQALRRRDYRALHEVLVEARRLGMPSRPLPRAAADLLNALGEAMELAEARPEGVR